MGWPRKYSEAFETLLFNWTKKFLHETDHYISTPWCTQIIWKWHLLLGRSENICLFPWSEQPRENNAKRSWERNIWKGPFFLVGLHKYPDLLQFKRKERKRKQRNKQLENKKRNKQNIKEETNKQKGNKHSYKKERNKVTKKETNNQRGNKQSNKKERNK